jgi:hypothetical protein
MLEQALAILWMDSLHPARARRALGCHARVLEPALIQELRTTIGKCDPPQAGKCLDKIGEFDLHLLVCAVSGVSSAVGLRRCEQRNLSKALIGINTRPDYSCVLTNRLSTLIAERRRNIFDDFTELKLGHMPLMRASFAARGFAAALECLAPMRSLKKGYIDLTCARIRAQLPIPK